MISIQVFHPTPEESERMEKIATALAKLTTEECRLLHQVIAENITLQIELQKPKAT